MHHNLSLSMIGKEKFWNTIKNLKKNLNFESDNDIVSIIRCILSTEYNLKTIVSKVGKQPAYYVQNDVDFLFKYYEKNDIARNGIMYIYFALYEKNGRKLRNNAMHGMLFGNDLTIPTFISFSCLIISSWLLNSLNKN